MQFSGGKLFRTDVGPISLSASFEMGGGESRKQITELVLSYSGLVLPFNAKKGLEVQGLDGKLRTLGPVAYEKKETGFVLTFDEGLGLELIMADSTKAQLGIELSIPDSVLPVKSVRIPYGADSKSSITANQNAAGFTMNHDGSDYALSLPTRAFVDAKNSYLVIPGDAPRKAIRFAIKSQNDGDEVESLLSNPGTLVGEKEYADGVNNFINASYLAWKGSRYNSGVGTWSLRDGESKFNEQIMVALLAEAWQRNEYTRVFAEMRSAADLHPNSLSWKSAVFLGSLKRMTNELVTKDKAETKRLLSLLEVKDHEVLKTAGLVQYAADRGGSQVRDALHAYLDGLDATSLNPAQLLGLYRMVYLDSIPDPSFEGKLEKFRPLFRDLVFKNFVRLDEGVFYVEDGKADTYLSILAGRILMEAGNKENEARYGNLGRNMVAASLRLADEMGYLPARIEYSASAIASLGVQVRGPEDIYDLVHSNPAYPKAISLFRNAGPGRWFYTIARVDSMSIKTGEYRMVISYPRLRTHYLMFFGLPRIDPLTGTELFGIVWRNASDFESYAKGRFYNPETKTLMIKYNDDSTSENIVIKMAQ